MTFLKSIYKGRPPTAFIPYRNDGNLQRTCGRLFKLDGEDVANFFMSVTTDQVNSYLFEDTVKNSGFSVTQVKEKIEESPFFNVRISESINSQDIKTLNKFQKINHFPEALQLTRKDLLASNMKRMKLKFPGEYNIAP